MPTPIDRIYWDEPYYLAPQGKTGIEAFAVIQRRHGKQEQGGAGPRWCCTSASVSARSSRATAASCSPPCARHDEIRSSGEVFDRTCPSPTRACCEIAEKIIDQQEAKFDPDAFQGPLRGRAARPDRAQEARASR